MRRVAEDALRVEQGGAWSKCDDVGGGGCDCDLTLDDCGFGAVK